MRKFLFILIAVLGLISCSSGDDIVKNRYAFVEEYSAEVVVGGVVGITERTFRIGETFEGEQIGPDLIAIRIAEHSRRNENCPNSWCYQEILEVPVEYLRRVE